MHTREADAALFGIFDVSILPNVLHIAFGVALGRPHRRVRPTPPHR
jgi:hypothetical protein